MKIPVLLLLFILLGMSACATYTPKPLPEDIGLADRVEIIKIDRAQIRLPLLRHYPFQPADGLDRFEVALVAVANNPELKAKFGKLAVAKAEQYSAGLFPDPQVSAGVEKAAEGAGKINGFNFGADYDFSSLASRAARKDAAASHRQRIQLELTWAQWETAQKAQSLAIQLRFQNQRIQLLKQALEVNKRRTRRISRLMKRGDAKLADAGAELIAQLNTAGRLDRLKRARSTTALALHTLLGLESNASLALGKLPEIKPVSSSSADKDLASLPERRPDLLALRAGYQSQEERVRAAILSQFPSIQLGFTRARDTDGLYTTGLGISLQLPIFSGNRGAIATARATREQLRAEYQQRIEHTHNEIKGLLAAQKLLLIHRQRLTNDLPKLTTITQEAAKSYQRGDMPALNYLSLELALIDLKLEALKVEASLWEIQIDLETLLAHMRPVNE